MAGSPPIDPSEKRATLMTQAIPACMNSTPWRSTALRLLFGLFAIVHLAGCAVDRATTKASPTSFLASTGHGGEAQLARLPFERSWRNPAWDANRYQSLVIRPVSTNHLRTHQWQQSLSTYVDSEQAFRERAAQLARRWDDSLRKAAATQSTLQLTNEPANSRTVILEIAMTEVVFGHPLINAASYAVPGGMLANAACFAPSVAFEARFKDAATGQLLATVSDRRTSKLKLIDLNKFTFSNPNREICSEWSTQLMESLDPKAVVKRHWVSLF